jgi:hypothetical protein
MALTETQLSQLAEHDVSEEEFNALRPEDQQALLFQTPDDTVHMSDEAVAAADAKRAAELAAQQPEPTPQPTAAPVATPQPTAAPVATPEPTAAPVAAPVATPAPTAAPQWRAVTADDPLGLSIGDDLVAPPRLVTKEDVAKIEETRTKLDELTDKFTEGDITADEFKTQRKALETELNDLQGRQTAQIALDATYQQGVEKTWNALVDESFKIAKASGIDYSAEASKPMLDELDATVKRLGQAAPLMHPDKSPMWRDKWALAEAHKQVAAKHGFEFKIPTAPGAVAAAGRAAPDLSQIPPTLRQAPAAADASIQGDEFAHLDAMTPAEAEKAVAMMTPEQEARYLAR